MKVPRTSSSPPPPQTDCIMPGQPTFAVDPVVGRASSFDRQQWRQHGSMTILGVTSSTVPFDVSSLSVCESVRLTKWELQWPNGTTCHRVGWWRPGLVCEIPNWGQMSIYLLIRQRWMISCYPRDPVIEERTWRFVCRVLIIFMLYHH